tara:strand:+ start:440 stop:559 length:120 start_codon:yes stop_codon:yes gene_type:complete
MPFSREHIESVQWQELTAQNWDSFNETWEDGVPSTFIRE